ncbi:hypothetical protein KFW00_26335, partial [Klebsiella pneumoniae]
MAHSITLCYCGFLCSTLCLVSGVLNQFIDLTLHRGGEFVVIALFHLSFQVGDLLFYQLRRFAKRDTHI